MLKKLFKNKLKIAFGILLVVLLIGVRAFETQLFYDPFLSYFKQEYVNLPFPELNNFKLALHLSFRYFLNSIISLALLWVLFRDKEMIAFAGFLYLIFFVLLLLIFFVVLHLYGEQSKMLLFYIRRFLIQPLFILLFIPAFYFQNQKK